MGAQSLVVMTVGLVVLVRRAAGDERADTALDACGLPRGYWPTSHCFNDRTHHTCCLLGPEARKYADASGNPIGSASSKAFEAKHNVSPTSSDLTPWCTCFGSLVCSYYAEKFDDGTRIKFIYEPESNPPRGAFAIPPSKNCEAKAREYFQVQAHGTPGVTDPNGAASACLSYEVQDHITLLSHAVQSGPDKVSAMLSGSPSARSTHGGASSADDSEQKRRDQTRDPRVCVGQQCEK